MKSYTDIEQSHKLVEILPLESADMCLTFVNNVWNPVWGKADDIYQLQKDCYEPDYTKDDYIDIDEFEPKVVPCWSLAALMDMLPSEFTVKGKYTETTYKIHIRKYALTKDVDLHQIAYGNYKIYEDGSSSWKDMINTGEKENLIDAAFQMICWLKENKKL